MFIEFVILLFCLLAHQHCYVQKMGPNGHKQKSLVSDSIKNDMYECNVTFPDKNLKLCDFPFEQLPQDIKFILNQQALCMTFSASVKHFCNVPSHDQIKLNESYQYNDIRSFCLDMKEAVKDCIAREPKNDLKVWMTAFVPYVDKNEDCQQLCMQREILNPICAGVLNANVQLKTLKTKPTEKGADKQLDTNSETSIADEGKFSQDNLKPVKSDLLSVLRNKNQSVTKEVSGAQQDSRNKTDSVESLATVKLDKEIAPATNASGFVTVKSKFTKKEHDNFEGSTDGNKSLPKQEEQQSLTLTENSKNEKLGTVTEKSSETIQSNKFENSVKDAASTVSTSNTDMPMLNKDKKVDSTSTQNVQSTTTPSPEDGEASVDYPMSVGQDNSDIENEDDAVIDNEQLKNKGSTKDDSAPVPDQGLPGKAQGTMGLTPNGFVNAEDSHFFAYFMTMVILCIIGYLVFHNKQKILALALEGRSRRGTRRRPNTSGYRKLDSNLEEAVTSACSTSVTHVIY